jgi:TonB family protein
MKTKLAMVVTVCGLLMPLLNASDKADKQTALRQTATLLLEAAVSKTNIFELPAFQMKARIQVRSANKYLDGSYQLLWHGPEQWREEIVLPGYTEVQVGGKGMLWIQRSTDFLPLSISGLRSALGFGSAASFGPRRFGSLFRLGLVQNDTIKDIHARKEHGEPVTCVKVEDDQKVSSEICVNVSSGTILRDSQFEDKDFQLFSGKIFPRSLSFSEDGNAVARVNISELTIPSEFPQDAFTPPTGISPLAGCMNPSPVHIVKKVSPEYPEVARHAYIQGRVGVDVWIGTNGIPQINKVVARVSPDLDRSTQEAIAQWRYEPATCGGTPVATETVLSIKYSLSN